ncbi:MAG: TonB family protein [Gammaproteobacteria bacterium]|nr:TonB family protein [Gammaproteobacteria bacterium]MBU2676318.1 TonB family protein [Gammaproteobacteria bacterium]NNC57817.1 TonB family protein [Woeseiaceae bacterium]NNL50052.1 TonB family protein [Woeseiaceae bacterium]
MANFARKSDPLDELMLVAPVAPDRLPAMLFLAALVHGILIIGVTFNAALVNQFADAISLEVTIVADPDQQIDQPDKASYLAQASQEGGGNTAEQVRPAAPLQSAMPVDNPGREDGTGLVEATRHERAADEVLTTRNDSDRAVTVDPRSEPQPEDSTAIAMEAGSEATLPLPQEDDASMLIRDDEPRQLIISADTRESVVAVYLDTWKRRIEAVGESYLPELGDIGDISGSPTLMVSIDASGALTDALIRKTSGSTLLDLAALDILQRASPFDPFPAEIAAEYDTLRFEYKWLFADQLVPTVSHTD